MKMILFASALALGTAAYAQDAMQPAPATPPMDQSAPAAPPAPDASAMPATPDAGAAPAAAPADPSATATTPVDDSSLPMCSKTVTDKCKQGGGMHHSGKHRMHKK